MKNMIIKENNEEKRNKKTEGTNAKNIMIAKIAISLLIGILSFTCFSNIAASPKFHESTIEMLDKKKVTVMELSAGTAIVANSASLILGDRAQPVATKLMDLTGYFLIILCAIILEKYLLTILGLVSFKILLPLASLLFLINVFVRNKGIEKISIKLAMFSIILFLVIPSSIAISRLIESTYSANVQSVIDSTKEIKEEADKINQNMKDNLSEETNEEIIIEDNNETIDNGLFSNIGNLINQVKEKGVNIAKGAKEKVTNFVGVVSEKAKQLFTKTTTLLGNMIEVIAVMIVTTCIMPILVLLFFIWIIKMFFGLDIKTENIKFPKVFE